jgi:hypothetical protein
MEKTWKITNISNQTVKFACKVGNTQSKGVQLNPSEFCVVLPQITKTMDAQSRRKLITVDKEFDNSHTNFPIGDPLNVEMATKLIEEASLNANKYIKQN